MDKKYYWLKLKKDFFKRHDIKIIEDMDNGKDYILFYLKLLCESVDHNGNLRFSDTIPYNEKMLSTITNTNIDIVRCALKVFSDLNMLEILEDKTIYMTECNKMLGSETYWAEQKRKQREIGHCPTIVQSLSNMSNQDIDKEKDIELDNIESKKESKEINILSNTHAHESYDDIISDFGVSEELKPALIEFIRHCQINKKVVTNDKLKNIIIRLDMNNNSETEKIQSLKRAINGGYFDILEGR